MSLICVTNAVTAGYSELQDSPNSVRGRAGEKSAKDMAVITGTWSLTNLSQASVARDLKLNCERRNTLTDELINKALGLTYLFPVKPENVAIMFSHSQAYSELFH